MVGLSFYGVFADSRLFAHAGLDLHLYFSSVRGEGGDGGAGGVMTSMRIRLVSSGFFVASYVCRISHRFLRCFAESQLSAHASLDLHLSFSSVRGWGGGGIGGG